MNTFFAETDVKGEKLRFRLHEADRRGGIFVIGKPGVGKTAFLAALALQDIARQNPVVVIDGDGALVTEVASRIPLSRKKDLSYYAPAAHEAVSPISFAQLAPNSIVLVDVSRRRLGYGKAAAWTEEFLKAVYLRQLSQQFQRTVPFLGLYIDANAGALQESFARFSADAEGLDIALTVSLRYVSEISRSLFESLLSMLAVRILFSLGSHDADHFEKIPGFNQRKEILAALPEGTIITNFRSRQDGLPLFTARAVTPHILGFTLREDVSEKLHAVSSSPQAPQACVDEIPRDTLESLLDVQFA